MHESSFRPTLHAMKLNDEQSIFPLLQLATSSETAPREMSVKEPVPVLPKIECHSSMLGRTSGSPPCRRNGGKYSRSCPALSTRSRTSGWYMIVVVSGFRISFLYSGCDFFGAKLTISLIKMSFLTIALLFKIGSFYDCT